MTARIAYGLAVFGLMAAGTLGSRAWAADAAHPYSNIDHSVDAGNDTGDSQVDRLNQQQLDQAGSGSGGGGTGTNGQWRRPSQGGYAGQGYGAARAVPGYYAPPPYVAAVGPYGWHRRWWWRHHWVRVAPLYP